MYSSFQEREHYEHEMGCYSNEFQAAYDLSRREARIVNHTALIQKWVSKGLYVAVHEHDVCCPFTDALLGRDIRIVGVCRDRNRALAMLKLGSYPEDDENYVTGPKTPCEECGKPSTDGLCGECFMKMKRNDWASDVDIQA